MKLTWTSIFMRAACVVAMTTLLVASLGVGLPRVDTVDPLSSNVRRVPDVRARLAALTPTDPEAYLLLGEEVADEARTPADTHLAEGLFVRAAVYAERAGRDHVVSAAALALSDLSGSSEDRAWLHAMAVAYGHPDGIERTTTNNAPGQRAAAAISALRDGEGGLARSLLREPGVAEAMDAAVPPSGPRAEMLAEQAENWPDSACRGRGVVRSGVPGDYYFDLCPVCRGRIGPVRTTSELRTELRVQSALAVGDEPFAAEVLRSGATPLRPLHPSTLGVRYGQDTERTSWRSGEWVSPAGSPDA